MRAPRCLIATAVGLACTVAFPTPNEAEDRICQSATSFEVRELYANYADHLRRGDVEALTGLYSPDAILMGPAAETIRLGRAEIATYYTTFLQRSPTVVPLERIVRTDCGALGDSGIEAMSFRPDPGKDRPVTRTSRFSLSYARFGERWLIVHHHQELIDANPATDVPLASVPPSRMITGTNPAAAEASPIAPVVVPAAPFELPKSPPVILGRQPPLVVTPPPAAIDHAALATMIALAHESATVRLPTLPAATIPPLLTHTEVSDRDQTPTSHRNVSAPEPVGVAAPGAIHVSVPPLPFTLPSLTIASAPPVVAAPPVTTTVEGAAPLSPPVPVMASTPPDRKTVPAVEASTPKPALKPAVAGFTQRAPPPAPAAPRPSAPAAALPKPIQPQAAPAVQARPASSVKASAKPLVKDAPVKTGKFLRWEDKTPIFDD